jgi:hypothetical protein
MFSSHIKVIQFTGWVPYFYIREQQFKSFSAWPAFATGCTVREKAGRISSERQFPYFIIVCNAIP